MRDVVELVEGEHIEEDDVGGRSRWLIALLGIMLRRPQDTLAAAMASAALITVMVNALFLQPNPHPAPLFSVRLKAPTSARSDSTGAVIALPRPRPADHASPRLEPAASPAPAGRARADIITDLQRELTRRGFYSGAIDGIHGSRTAAAIRELEQAAGTRFGAEPSEPMLQAILRAPASARAGGARRSDPIGDLVLRTAPQVTVSSSEAAAAAPSAPPVLPSAAPDPGAERARPEPGEPTSQPRPSVAALRPEPLPAPARSEAAAVPTRLEPQAPATPVSATTAAPADHPTPRADLPSPQVKAVQRALSEYGYGQLKPTGIVDAPTAAAIRDFEDMRGLPITGQMSDRIVQELAKVTDDSIE